jgi:hypothetical protein
MQDINLSIDLHGVYGTEGVRFIRQRDFEDTASDTFKGLRVLRHAAKLNELQFVTDQFLRT